jgi:hypothetical protein
MKSLFLSRVQACTNESPLPFCVQVYKGEDTTNYRHDDLWEIVFAGQKKECDLFQANMHHAIEPNMANAEVVTNPKRVIEI